MTASDKACIEEDSKRGERFGIWFMILGSLVIGWGGWNLEAQILLGGVMTVGIGTALYWGSEKLMVDAFKIR